MQITVKEEAFSPLFKLVYPDTSDYLIEMGSAGSGKSERGVAKVLMRCLQENNHRFVNWRKVGKSIRNSSWKLFKDQIVRWNLRDIFDIKETEMNLICKLNGNEVLSMGMDDEQKIKSLTSPTGFYVEEFNEFTEMEWNQLDTRLRGYSENYKQIYACFNPVDENIWIRRRFFPDYVEEKLKERGFAYTTKEIEIEGKKQKITSLIVHSTYKDNPFLPDKDKAKLEAYKEISDYHYTVYALGWWGSLGNLIFPNGFIWTEEYPLEYDEIIYGLDFGFNNPTALVKIGIKDQEYYLEEMFYESGYTNLQLAEEMLGMDFEPYATIYADSQEPARIAELNDYFYKYKKIDVKSSDKSVKDGIDHLKSCKIHTKKDNVIINRELKAYRWKEDSLGNVIEGMPVKINDHYLDAIRYPIYTHSLAPELKMAFI